MAIRYAIANGNWSNPAIWDGGVAVPASTDDVYANNFTVNIDVNVTVATLRTINLASPVIALGGVFAINAGVTLTHTADSLAAYHKSSIGGTIVPNPGGGGTMTVNFGASIVGPANSVSKASCIGVSAGFTGTFNINVAGTMYGGSGTDGCTLYIAAVGGTRTINLTVAVEILGNTGNGGHAIFVTAGTTGTVNISTPSIRGAYAISASGMTWNIASGTVILSTSTSSQWLITVGTSTWVFTGCTIRGSNGSVNAFATIITAASTTPIITFRDCTFHNGNVASIGAPALENYIAGARVRISGDIYCGGIAANTGGDGYFPIRGMFSADTGGNGLRIHAPNDISFPASNDGNETILSMYGSASGLPAPADVRSGTLYGPSSDLAGTLAVPPAVSVAAGVPVDASVGTGGVKLADIASTTGAQIAAALDA